MPTKINFGRGLKSKIPTIITDGMVNFTTDTNELFIDTSSGRTPIGIVRGSGDYSALLNNTNNTASGEYSIASGFQTVASHRCSSVFGTGTRTGNKNQTVIGVYNDPHSDTLFEIGNGTDTKRSNVFMAFADGHVEVQKQGDTDNSVVTKNYFESNNSSVMPCEVRADGVFIFDKKTPNTGSTIIAIITNGSDTIFDGAFTLGARVQFSDSGEIPLNLNHFSIKNLKQYSMFGIYFSGSSAVYVGILNGENGDAPEPTPPEPEITEIDDGVVGTSESTGSLDDGVVGVYDGTAELDDGVVE